ncbi:hypothetical protein HELRODRAFT_169480 [Helobdella robusta]|uniref:EGF-like calcium-binding domain-containing protein n=1 Tax=Helobdella robusta TaxID=6412 RepID=T1F1Z8_HELRO|nr:hypothetical protein HELRODRAFT_169480 [Helobdella robusta]ESO08601.1 hypothetical protein HELRODRAFT_169480 [Helobdella robusta]
MILVLLLITFCGDIVTTFSIITRSNFIGCYYNVLTASVATENRMKLEQCLARCNKADEIFSALSVEGFCICRSTVEHGTEIDPSYCGVSCQGGVCENPHFFAVFSTCNAYYYGHNCSKLCLCMSMYCRPLRGICLDQSECIKGATKVQADTAHTCPKKSCQHLSGDCMDQCRHSLKYQQIMYFPCECSDGYYMPLNRHACEDIDECINHKCKECRNEPGSFRCTCNEGLVASLHGNSAICVNEIGNCAVVDCPQGWCYDAYDGSARCPCPDGNPQISEGNQKPARQVTPVLFATSLERSSLNASVCTDFLSIMIQILVKVVYVGTFAGLAHVDECDWFVCETDEECYNFEGSYVCGLAYDCLNLDNSSSSVSSSNASDIKFYDDLCSTRHVKIKIQQAQYSNKVFMNASESNLLLSLIGVFRVLKEVEITDLKWSINRNLFANHTYADEVFSANEIFQRSNQMYFQSSNYNCPTVFTLECISFQFKYRGNAEKVDYECEIYKSYQLTITFYGGYESIEETAETSTHVVKAKVHTTDGLETNSTTLKWYCTRTPILEPSTINEQSRCIVHQKVALNATGKAITVKEKDMIKIRRSGIQDYYFHVHAFLRGMSAVACRKLTLLHKAERIAFECISNCNYKINMRQRLYFKVNCSKCSEFNISWFFVHSPDDIISKTNQFIIESFDLNKLSSAEHTVKVLVVDNYSSSKYQHNKTFEIDKFQNYSCNILPPEGLAFSTRFTLVCPKNESNIYKVFSGRCSETSLDALLKYYGPLNVNISNLRFSAGDMHDNHYRCLFIKLTNGVEEFDTLPFKVFNSYFYVPNFKYLNRFRYNKLETLSSIGNAIDLFNEQISNEVHDINYKTKARTMLMGFLTGKWKEFGRELYHNEIIKLVYWLVYNPNEIDSISVVNLLNFTMLTDIFKYWDQSKSILTDEEVKHGLSLLTKTLASILIAGYQNSESSDVFIKRTNVLTYVTNHLAYLANAYSKYVEKRSSIIEDTPVFTLVMAKCSLQTDNDIILPFKIGESTYELTIPLAVVDALNSSASSTDEFVDIKMVVFPYNPLAQKVSTLFTPTISISLHYKGEYLPLKSLMEPVTIKIPTLSEGNWLKYESIMMSTNQSLRMALPALTYDNTLYLIMLKLNFTDMSNDIVINYGVFIVTLCNGTLDDVSQRTDVYENTKKKFVDECYELVIKQMNFFESLETELNFTIPPLFNTIYSVLIVSYRSMYPADVSLELNMLQLSCQYWYESTGSDDSSSNEESTYGCAVSPKGTTSELLECQCFHLSTFTGSISYPNSSILIDFYGKLSGKSKLGIYTLSFIWIFFFFFGAWAKYTDLKLKNLSYPVDLADNFPAAEIVYLVIVETGVRPFAGCTGTAFIMLIGSVNKSLGHKLVCKHYQTLQKGHQNFFIIRTKETLGKISKEAFFFFFDTWLCVNVKGQSSDVTVNAVSHVVRNDFKHLLTTNFFRGFEDSHVWFSIFTCPILSTYTRFQRVAVCMLNLEIFLLTTLILQTLAFGFGLSPIFWLITYMFSESRPRKVKFNIINDWNRLSSQALSIQLTEKKIEKEREKEMEKISSVFGVLRMFCVRLFSKKAITQLIYDPEDTQEHAKQYSMNHPSVRYQDYGDKSAKEYQYMPTEDEFAKSKKLSFSSYDDSDDNIYNNSNANNCNKNFSNEIKAFYATANKVKKLRKKSFNKLNNKSNSRLNKNESVKKMECTDVSDEEIDAVNNQAHRKKKVFFQSSVDKSQSSKNIVSHRRNFIDVKETFEEVENRVNNLISKVAEKEIKIDFYNFGVHRNKMQSTNNAKKQNIPDANTHAEIAETNETMELANKSNNLDRSNKIIDINNSSSKNNINANAVDSDSESKSDTSSIDNIRQLKAMKRDEQHMYGALPWWVKYVNWFFMALYHLGTGATIYYYINEYSHEINFKWYLKVFATLCCNIFLIDPAVIIFLAFLFSLMTKQYTKFTVSRLRIIRNESLIDLKNQYELHRKRVTKLRVDPRYKLTSKAKRKIKFEKKFLESRYLVLNIIIYTYLALCGLVISFSVYDFDTSLLTQTIDEVFFGKRFRAINTREDFYSWLEDHFIQLAYPVDDVESSSTLFFSRLHNFKEMNGVSGHAINYPCFTKIILKDGKMNLWSEYMSAPEWLAYETACLGYDKRLALIFARRSKSVNFLNSNHIGMGFTFYLYFCNVRSIAWIFATVMQPLGGGTKVKLETISIISEMPLPYNRIYVMFSMAVFWPAFAFFIFRNVRKFFYLGAGDYFTSIWNILDLIISLIVLILIILLCVVLIGMPAALDSFFRDNGELSTLFYMSGVDGIYLLMHLVTFLCLIKLLEIGKLDDRINMFLTCSLKSIIPSTLIIMKCLPFVLGLVAYKSIKYPRFVEEYEVYSKAIMNTGFDLIYTKRLCNIVQRSHYECFALFFNQVIKLIICCLTCALIRSKYRQSVLMKAKNRDFKLLMAFIHEMKTKCSGLKFHKTKVRFIDLIKQKVVNTKEEEEEASDEQEGA